MPDLSTYRARFGALERCCHLISNSLGVMPDAARDGAARYLDEWATRSVRAWEESWWMLARHVGDRIGALAGAPPDTVSMHPNVTSAEAVVLSCFDVRPPRDKVVAVEMEFPSILYLYREWLRDGGRLEIVPCPDGITVPTERLLAAIDETTLLVPISHVLFRSSCIVDARAVIERAHAVGAMVVLDLFQSLGSIPVNLAELQVDFAVGGCLKWLCGGPGACFLYVRPDLAPRLEPRFTGWLAHRDPFAFDAGPLVRTDGAYRFQSGTPNIPALYTCQAGLDIVTEIGSGAIREHSLALTGRLLAAAKQRDWPTTVPPAAEQRAGTVALNLPDGRAIAEELCRRDVLVDYRPQAGIRVSPHFYNTAEEIDHLVSEIEAIRRERDAAPTGADLSRRDRA